MYTARYLPVKKDNEYKGEKLFLCSDNIYYADSVFSPRNGFYKFGEVENSYKNESIKIIGEISDKVNWLQDGDEILEEEFKIIITYQIPVFIWHRGTGKSVEMFDIEKDWNDELIEEIVSDYMNKYGGDRAEWNFNDIHVKDSVIKIKCKCCNTYI